MKAPRTTAVANGCRQGAAALVRNCARLQRGELSYVISEPATRAVAEYVTRAIAEVSLPARHDTIAGASMHGQEPPDAIARHMAEHDVVFCLTRASMAHTRARKRATDGGTRFLSLPDYSLALLAGEGLRADFESLRPRAERIAARLDIGATVTLRSELGTDLSLAISGRKANCCPGICRRPGDLASPPDAEVNIAPVEGSAHGVAWIDGSIPCAEIGLVAQPVGLDIRDGRIVECFGPRDFVARLEEVFHRAGTTKALMLGEFGIGLNPRARLCGRMLEDEGCAGTVHLGFGSNATIGGRTEVAFHLDCVIRRPRVWIDRSMILHEGVWSPALC